ncbi:MAG: ABC transporter ATP-binding protein [Deltaproteobacteria bacterium]|nr:ABC transporter ATP-binding protein [Deltaproteobacteria bacterium]
MIQIKNLHKSFGPQKVLNGVNLDIPQGQITVILGRSGEGKTVLLKHLMGLILADSGQVLVEGIDVNQLGEHALNEFRKRFGFLFQHAALFDSLNVYENVAFPLKEHTRFSKNQIDQIVEEKLSLVGLKNIQHKMPSQLSGGMRKRVGLARAIALSPQIILYDEPTTGLDPLMTDSVDQLILETQRKLNITSVVISHDIEATFKIADKIAMLHEGRIIEEGNPEAFRKSSIPFVKRFLEGRAGNEVIV